MVSGEARVEAVELGVGWVVETNIPTLLPKQIGRIVSTETLGMAFEPEQKYENPDGTPIAFDGDYLGCFEGWRVVG